MGKLNLDSDVHISQSEAVRLLSGKKSLDDEERTTLLVKQDRS